MNRKRTKLLAVALTIGAMPLALSGACNPLSGSISVFRGSSHDSFFVEDVFYDDYYYEDYYYDDAYYYEDDCFFFGCGF